MRLSLELIACIPAHRVVTGAYTSYSLEASALSGFGRTATIASKNLTSTRSG